jgi:CBS domain-containing protein
MREDGVASLVVASSGSDLVAGVVTESDLLRALLAGQAEGMAADVMNTDTPVTTAPHETLAAAVSRMQAEGAGLAIVMGGEPARPLGVLTAADVVRYLATRGGPG